MELDLVLKALKDIGAENITIWNDRITFEVKPEQDVSSIDHLNPVEGQKWDEVIELPVDVADEIKNSWEDEGLGSETFVVPEQMIKRPCYKGDIGNLERQLGILVAHGHEKYHGILRDRLNAQGFVETATYALLNRLDKALRGHKDYYCGKNKRFIDWYKKDSAGYISEVDRLLRLRGEQI